MKSFRLEMLVWLTVVSSLASPVAAGVPTPPVQNLVCNCTTAAVGKPLASLAWQNPQIPTNFFLQIRRDGAAIALVPGVVGQPLQSFDDLGPPPGPHVYEVIAIDQQGQPSKAAVCNVTCPPDAVGRPAAIVEGPQRIVLPPAGIAEAFFDGRASRDSRGARALQYQWIASEPALIEVLSPSSFLTRVRFLGPGDFFIMLRVFETSGQQIEDVQQLRVEVVAQGPKEPAGLFPPPPDLLVAIAGRLFDLPLTFVAGQPFPDLQLVSGPEGLIVDPAFSKILWIPPLSAAGRKATVQILASNPFDQQVLPIEIRVLDPAEPVTAYAFPLPKGGRDDPGAGAGGGDEAGGGGSLGPAPAFLSDQAPAEPSLALELSPLSGAEACTVQLITAGGAPADPFDGLLFNPGCAGVGSAGLYSSGSAGSKLLESITNDFTVELWLSSVSAAVPPGGRAFVFSMSSGTAGINWLVGHDGGQKYTAIVRVNGVDEALSVTAAPRPNGLVNLVFVRQGDEHRLYVNGSRAASRAVPHADSVDATWDASYQVCLGNSSDETRPFNGRFHFAAVYGVALSDAIISLLDTLGPKYPLSDGDVPPPIADICPDPREIRRGVDADGTHSRSGIGGGGAGDGGGASGDGCPDTLRPFEWTASPSVSWSVTWSPASGEEICKRQVRVDYDPIPPGSRFDVEITLKVTQVPVRGVTKTATDTKTIRVPTYFKRGDSNQDDSFDISDGIKVLVSLFLSAGDLDCADAGDANDDGKLDTSDAVYVFRSLFSSGPAPPAPFPACGADPSTDGPPGWDLGCYQSPPYCR